MREDSVEKIGTAASTVTTFPVSFLRRDEARLKGNGVDRIG
jgi:hypothetical protein